MDGFNMAQTAAERGTFDEYWVTSRLSDEQYLEESDRTEDRKSIN